MLRKEPFGTEGRGSRTKHLINLGLAVAVAAGASCLTVSASDLPSAMPDLQADPLAYEYEPVLFDLSRAYEQVEIPEAGLALDVPASWQQLDQEPAWSPDGSGEERIGVSWFHLVPVIKPEAVLLPGGGLIVASTPIALEWGTGRQYLVKDYGVGEVGQGAWSPALSVEIHTLVTVVDGETLWTYDLHAVAPTEAELATLKPVLDVMLASMRLTIPPPVQAPGGQALQPLDRGVRDSGASRILGLRHLS